MHSGEINTPQFYAKFGSAEKNKDVRQSIHTTTTLEKKNIPVVISNFTKRYRLKKAVFLKEETAWNAAPDSQPDPAWETGEKLEQQKQLIDLFETYTYRNNLLVW
jgi:hypothetical protein